MVSRYTAANDGFPVSAPEANVVDVLDAVGTGGAKGFFKYGLSCGYCSMSRVKRKSPVCSNASPFKSFLMNTKAAPGQWLASRNVTVARHSGIVTGSPIAIAETVSQHHVTY